MKSLDRTGITTLMLPLATETQTRLEFQDAHFQLESRVWERLLWSDSSYVLCWKLLRFTLMVLRNKDISKEIFI